MTPKEKAIEIFKNYYCLNNNSKSKIKVIEFDTAKQCAIICVNELLDTVPYINNTQSEVKQRIYYMDVRTEINKL